MGRDRQHSVVLHKFFDLADEARIQSWGSCRVEPGRLRPEEGPLFSIMASFPCFRMLDYDWYVRFDSALVISLARNWLWVGQAIEMDMLRRSFRNRDTIRPSRIAMAVVDSDLNVGLLARNVEKGHGFVPCSWNPSLDDGPMFAADRDTCVSRLVGRSSIQSSQRSVIHFHCSLIHHGAPSGLSDQNLRPLRADN